jgi:heme/copper-type cytochrome/quinol oxidase subunit 2
MVFRYAKKIVVICLISLFLLIASCGGEVTEDVSVDDGVLGVDNPGPQPIDDVPDFPEDDDDDADGEVDDDTDENLADEEDGPGDDEIELFILTGENFKFVRNGVDNPDIKVDLGETVRIEFTSTSGFHDWVVDEFSAATEQVKTDGSTFVEFVADKKGTFEYYCSVGSHRANGMKGNLIVE